MPHCHGRWSVGREVEWLGGWVAGWLGARVGAWGVASSENPSPPNSPDALPSNDLTLMSYLGLCPFEGRGGFWRTTSLCAVGMDYETVAEDHDSTFRLYAYFGEKGIYDLVRRGRGRVKRCPPHPSLPPFLVVSSCQNMLAQENNPPDWLELTKQRVRWDTGQFEKRRAYSWLMCSNHISDVTAVLAVFNGLFNCKASLPGDFICWHMFNTILGVMEMTIIVG